MDLERQFEKGLIKEAQAESVTPAQQRIRRILGLSPKRFALYTALAGIPGLAGVVTRRLLKRRAARRLRRRLLAGGLGAGALGLGGLTALALARRRRRRRR